MEKQICGKKLILNPILPFYQGARWQCIEWERKMLEMPRRFSSGSAGYDIELPSGHILKPGEKASFRTGWYMQNCPPNHFMMLSLRSSFAVENDVALLGGIIGLSWPHIRMKGTCPKKVVLFRF